MSPNRRSAILAIMAGATASPLLSQAQTPKVCPRRSCQRNIGPNRRSVLYANSPLRQDFTGDESAGGDPAAAVFCKGKGFATVLPLDSEVGSRHFRFPQ